MFIEIHELITHLRAESIASIIRNDETLAYAAIDGAVAEAKGYLSRFNTSAIFSATRDNRHQLLLIFIKDIAVWHLCNLVNPNIDLKLRKERYDRAIAWLKDVQAGIIQPDLPPATGIDINTGIISYGSNNKNTYEW